MGVHDRLWHPYHGELTDSRWRFLVLPRYASREVFKTRIFTFFLTACCFWPFLCIVFIYLKHNLDLLEIPVDFIPPLLRGELGPDFFLVYLRVQAILAWLLAVVVGPATMSPDLVNGALPLYLSRPLERWEYLLGKGSVLLALTSLVSWIPAVLMFAIEGALDKGGWAFENLRILGGLVGGGLALVATLTLTALAISAVFKTTAAARATYMALLFVSSAGGFMINETLDTTWGSFVIVDDCIEVFCAGLLGAEVSIDYPFAAATASIATVLVLSIVVLAKKLRPLEVVK